MGSNGDRSIERPKCSPQPIFSHKLHTIQENVKILVYPYPKNIHAQLTVYRHYYFSRAGSWTDFDDVIFFPDFFIKNIVRQCEVPIPDVSLCLCLDMRLREQCYLNGGAHVWNPSLENHIDKVVTLMKKHLKNGENTSIKVFFVFFAFV